MQGKKVVVWGGTYTNKGSLAMLETLSEMYPSYDISFVCDHKSDEIINDLRFKPIAGAYGVFTYAFLFLKLMAWRLSFKTLFKHDSIVQELIDADKFIDLSGFALTEDFSKNSCTYRGAVYLMQALISRLVTSEYYIYPQAFGPIERPLNKAILIVILYLSKKTFVRGRRSFEFCKRYKGSHVVMTNDLVFLNRAYRQASAPRLNEPYVLINPNSRIYIKQQKEGKKDYFETLLELVRELSASYHVVLTPNEIRENEIDDLDICNELFEQLKGNDKVSVNKNVEISNLLSLCEHAQFAVVSRFHLMIFCLLKGTLPVVISWSEKYLDIMEVFDLDCFVFPEEDFHFKLLSLERLTEKGADIKIKSESIYEEMKRDIWV